MEGWPSRSVGASEMWRESYQWGWGCHAPHAKRPPGSETIQMAARVGDPSAHFSMSRDMDSRVSLSPAVSSQLGKGSR